MMRNQDNIRWPLWLWSLQLIPAGFLLVISASRIVSRAELQAIDLKSIIGLIVGLAWLAGALAMLSMPRSRAWIILRWREWCLTAGSTLVAVVILDIALTLTGFVPTVETQKAHSISYTPESFTPRLIQQHIVVENANDIHINRRGFRGPEIEPLKASGVPRIVFLGGSQVFDYHGGGWPELVGSELHKKGIEVEVINAGVPGHNSTDSLRKLITDLWVLYPDLVFLCNTWNDVKYYRQLTAANPYRGLPPLEPTPIDIDWRMHPKGLDRLLSASSLYRSIRVALIEYLISEEGIRRGLRNQRASASNTDWANYDAHGPQQLALNLRLVLALTREIGAELILCRQARLEFGSGTTGMPVEEYSLRNTRLTLAELERAFAVSNVVIDSLASEERLSLVDMHNALKGKARYFHDGIHFSPEGSRVISVFVANALEDKLRSIGDHTRSDFDEHQLE